MPRARRKLRVAPPRALTDEQLVAALRAGDDDAMTEIDRRYRDRLLAYVRRMSAGADAEDVVQDVLARAYLSLRGDDRPMALRAWLYRVAHNRCLDLLRRPAPVLTDNLEIGTGARTGLSLAEQVAGRERLRQVVADIQGLPDQQRSALIIRELEGLSYEELAEALETTVPAIKSLLVRARMNLARAADARTSAEEASLARFLPSGPSPSPSGA
jgi:RNA polymerase sigma factor (sigma-70 family)